MDTFTLKHLLDKLTCNCVVRRKYVLARDQIYQVDFRVSPLILVVNTSVAAIKNFGHWLALVTLPVVDFNGKRSVKGYFFDSFGRDMEYYYLTFPIKDITVISKLYQAETTVTCGLWALLVAAWLVRGNQISEFYKMFSLTNRLDNDRKLIAFYRQFKFQPICRGQTCCSKLVFEKRQN